MEKVVRLIVDVKFDEGIYDEEELTRPGNTLFFDKYIEGNVVKMVEREKIKRLKVEDQKLGIGMHKFFPERIPADATFVIDVGDNHWQKMPEHCRSDIKNIDEAVIYANDLFNEKSNGDIFSEQIGVGIVRVKMMSSNQKYNNIMVYGLTIGSFGGHCP